MNKLGVLLGTLILASNAYAVEVDVSDLDENVRSSGSKSIMFRHSEGGQKAPVKSEEIKEEQPKPEAKVFQPIQLFGTGFKIMAVINGEIVTNKDLQERANLFALTTGISINDKNKKMIADKVLQNTIDEKIKLQEAKNIGVSVSERDIREAYLNFEKSNGMPAGKFKDILKEYKVSPKVFMKQIETNLTWNKLVVTRLSHQVDVSDREVEDEYRRIKKDMNTPKYMVSEIVIKRKDAEHISELVDILRKDERFALYAAQFSQSASAPSGGKIGWVAPGQLAKPLDDAIRKLKEGEVSAAIAYRADYYIFKLDKIYNPKLNKQKLPTNEEVRTFIQNRKTEELANKYIRDLRNKAVVEKKF